MRQSDSLMQVVGREGCPATHLQRGHVLIELPAFGVAVSDPLPTTAEIPFSGSFALTAPRLTSFRMGKDIQLLTAPIRGQAMLVRLAKSSASLSRRRLDARRNL